MAAADSHDVAVPIAMDELRAMLQRWLAEADEINRELRRLDRPLDSEWLCGRVCALKEVLGVLDGRPPEVGARGHLFATIEDREQLEM